MSAHTPFTHGSGQRILVDAGRRRQPPAGADLHVRHARNQVKVVAREGTPAATKHRVRTVHGRVAVARSFDDLMLTVRVRRSIEGVAGDLLRCAEDQSPQAVAITRARLGNTHVELLVAAGDNAECHVPRQRRWRARRRT